MFTFVSPARAEESLPLTTGEYPPYTGQKLPGGGVSTVLVKAIFKAAGLAEPKIYWQPWQRGYEAAHAGKYFATFPYANDPTWEQEFVYSDALHPFRRAFFTRKRFTKGITGDWDGLRLCNPLGWETGHLGVILKTFSMPPVLQPATMEACLRMVHGGRADLVSENTLAMAHTMKEVFGKSDALVESEYGQEDGQNLFFIISPNWPGHKHLRQKFNAGLAALRESGEYDRLVDEYVATHLSGSADTPSSDNTPATAIPETGTP